MTPPMTDTPKLPPKPTSPKSAPPAVSAAHTTTMVQPVEPWARIWFSLVRQPWSVLAVVPAHAGLSSAAAARALAEVGREYQTEPVEVADAEGMAAAGVRALLGSLAERSGSGGRILIAVRCPLDDPAAIPLARAADAAVLLVRLGRTNLRDAREVMEAIGAESFAGSVIVTR